jgi:membrane-bound lytic murein transglycosylase F
MTIIKKIAILVRKFFFFTALTLSIVTLDSCQNIIRDHSGDSIAEESPVSRYRIHDIQERGRLIAITEYNSTDYFVFRGEPMGYQYEKLRMFADFLGVDLEIRTITSLEEAFLSLEQGDADLIAMGLAVTLDRSSSIAFSDPILQTRQMLVQRKPENWRRMLNNDDIEEKLIRNPLELGGKTVVVQKSSAHAARLENLAEEIGWPIEISEDPFREVEQLVEAVARGEVEYTVCDEHTATLYERMYPEIDARTAISFPQNLAWAVRHDSDSLKILINDWLDKTHTSQASRRLFDKYFKSSRAVYMAKSESLSGKKNAISAYDDLMRDLSRKYDIDWRLVASLAYQESQFKPEVRSWKGAFGLMQMLPSTAALFGIDTTASEEEQIEAGIRYLKVLDRELPSDINDPDERVRFILAAYNAGIAHVFDARRLAAKHGKDPNVWEENVDYYIRNKSNPKYYKDSVVRYGYARGQETYDFVIEVLDRFEHYKNVVKD